MAPWISRRERSGAVWLGGFTAPKHAINDVTNYPAKLNGHDPYAYLKGVLTRLPMQKNSAIDELLPHRLYLTKCDGRTLNTQLTWRHKEGVPRMIVTHCGSQIVAGDERKVRAKLRVYAEERGIDAEIATDGMEVLLR